MLVRELFLGQINFHTTLLEPFFWSPLGFFFFFLKYAALNQLFCQL